MRGWGSRRKHSGGHRGEMCTAGGLPSGLGLAADLIRRSEEQREFAEFPGFCLPWCSRESHLTFQYFRFLISRRIFLLTALRLFNSFVSLIKSVKCSSPGR